MASTGRASGKVSSSKRAAVLFTALTALAHAKPARGQAVGLREPLFPRRDAATAIFDKPVSAFTYVTTDGRRVTGGEQDLFVRLGSHAGGHMFVGLDRSGRPAWAVGGAARQLSKALTGGITLFAPATPGARGVFTPGLMARLAQHDIVLKFAPSIDTGGAMGANAVVIKGLNLGRLRAALRVGGGIGRNTRNADVTATVGNERWAADVGGRFERGQTPVGRARLSVGSRHFYGAAAVESQRGRGTSATFSVGGEFGTGRQRSPRTTRRPHR